MQCQIAGKTTPIRIHGLLDDASRYGIALEAQMTEKEEDMLILLVDALRRHGIPDGLYLDNGATYRGEILRIVCTRLGITLLHAKPYDPQARGKMERFWRTLREQCLDHVGTLGSHHDVQVRLLAWLDRHYHVTPHSSLMGKTPAETFEMAPRKPIEEPLLREALVAHGRRRIRRDGTVQIAGKEFEVEQGFLAGRLVSIGRSLLTPTEAPWVEHEDQRLLLKPVDAKANAKARRLN